MLTRTEMNKDIGLKLITKGELIEAFKKLEAEGWIENYRCKKGKNDGSVGNIIEDRLGIPENNLPVPNAAEWELKAQRANTSSLLTLKHIEPSPIGARLVSNMLLPLYGWKHKEAGIKYPVNEMSFRSTTNAVNFTDRGFKLDVNRVEKKVEFIFDASKCDAKHSEWLESVKERIGLGGFSVNPYWGFIDLYTSVGDKLKNCFYIRADVKKENGKEYFHYNDVRICKNVNLDKFVKAIESGAVYIDFDARTGHNHGTKFRVSYNDLPLFYDEVEKII